VSFENLNPQNLATNKHNWMLIPKSMIYLFSCHGTNQHSYAETQRSFLLIAKAG